MSQVNNPASKLSRDSAVGLERHVKRFEAAWQSGLRPKIGEFLPEKESERMSVLVELVHTDIEYRLKAGELVRVEVYFERYPELVFERNTALDLIAAEYELRRRQDPSVLPEEYYVRFPHYSEDLASRLKAPFRGSVSSAPAAASHVLIETLLQPTEMRSRYTLSRIHAHGGLGTVWVARDCDLNRDVALKELKPEQGVNPEARNRFLKEAQVTGQLEHPNIVPVYELARRPEDDQPFYTMKLVRGQTLRDAIADYQRRRREGKSEPLELRRLLDVFVCVCNAIGYAHSRGVLHRDLKPENVVLGAFGEVVLLDWGLAKLVDQKDSEAMAIALKEEVIAPETIAGRILGTPAYMAPEQAEGRLDLVDARTDVYGLGAILFEILTGQPPHQGQRSAELIRRIVTAETPRTRSVEPSVPVGLDAVCAKAMAKTRPQRYGTASDFADDIQRWLADEPVSVYREPLNHRLARWARRHRAWTQAVAAALLIVTVVSLAAAVLINHFRHKEIAAKAEATRRFKQAREAIDTWLTGVSEVLKYYPGVLEARERLLQKAAEDYEQFANEKSDDIELQTEFAKAFIGLGDIRRELRQLAEAEHAYRQAETRLDKLSSLAADGADLRLELANCRTRLGILFRDFDRRSDADGAYRAAISMLRDLVEQYPDVPEYRDGLATSRFNHGLLLTLTGHAEEARQTLQDAVSGFEDLADSEPNKPRYRSGLAGARGALAHARSLAGFHQDAASILEDAILDLRKLAENEPSHPTYLEQLAVNKISLANIWRTLGYDSEEIHAYRDAIAAYEDLLKAQPDVPFYQERLALARTNLGQLLHELGDNIGAKNQLETALDRIVDLVKAHKDVNPFHRDGAVILSALGNVYSDLGKNGDGEDTFQNAIRTFNELDGQPDVPDYQHRMAVSRSNLGKLLHKQDRPQDAMKELQAAVEAFTKLIDNEPENLSLQDGLAWSYKHLGDLHWDQGDPPQASRAYAESGKLWEQLTKRIPPVPEYQLNLARFLTDCPSRDDSDVGRAITVATNLTNGVPKNGRYRSALGIAYFRADKLEDSVKSLEQAVELRTAPDCVDWFVLAMARWKLGGKEEARKNYDYAVQCMNENHPDNVERKRVRTEAAKRLGLVDPRQP